jgi:predicted GIY-YIG superfamily endonuclease
MTTTYLYRHYGANDELLYIGISLNSAARLQQHKEHSAWFDEIKGVTIDKFESRDLALFAEAQAIMDEQPKYNIQHKKRRQLEPEPPAAIEESKRDIVARLVRFNALYSIEEAAALLRMGHKHVRDMTQAGEIGRIVLPPYQRGYKVRTFISGWQIIEYLEHLHGKPLPTPE